jgi:hypothetical protein
MKTIQPVSIWDNGTVQQATILNCYATNVTLNVSATFWFGLYAENEFGFQAIQLTQGSLVMSGEAYEQWQVDSYAWDWIAEQLNLTITGDYIPPVPTTTTTTTTEAPETTTTTTEAP